MLVLVLRVLVQPLKRFRTNGSWLNIVQTFYAPDPACMIEVLLHGSSKGFPFPSPNDSIFCINLMVLQIVGQLVRSYR